MGLCSRGSRTASWVSCSSGSWSSSRVAPPGREYVIAVAVHVVMVAGPGQVEILAESVHDEEMMQAAMEVALNDAIDYNMKPHAFHAGRVSSEARSCAARGIVLVAGGEA